MSERVDEAKFTAVRPVQAEGARIGLVTCLECGAAVALDPCDDVNPMVLHREWHEAREVSRGE